MASQQQFHPLEDVQTFAFRGGGAKGLVYPGVVQALEEEIVHGKSMLARSRYVTGSSVGALTAAAIGLGMSSEELKVFTKNQNFLKLVKLSMGVTEVPFQTAKRSGLSSGRELYTLCKRLVKDMVQARLAELDKSELITERNKALEQQIQDLQAFTLAIKQMQHLSLTTKQIAMQQVEERCKALSAEQNRLAQSQAILRQLVHDIKLPGCVITYRHVAALRDFMPEKVKQIYIMATNKDDKKLDFFCAQHTPDVEIAKTLRMSASLPGVYKEVIHNGKRYIDGGVGKNLPICDFISKDLPQGKLNAIGFIPDNHPFQEDGEKKFRIMERIKHFIVSFCCRIPMKQNTIKEHAKLQDFIRRGNCRIINLEVGRIGTLSFTATNKDKEALYLKGYQGCKAGLARIKNPVPSPTYTAISAMNPSVTLSQSQLSAMYEAVSTADLQAYFPV